MGGFRGEESKENLKLAKLERLSTQDNETGNGAMRLEVGSRHCVSHTGNVLSHFGNVVHHHCSHCSHFCLSPTMVFLRGSE